MAAALAVAAPLAAVGLGPLKLEGLIDGPREGFSLDLYNPYPQTVRFVLYAVAMDGEEIEQRVSIFPAAIALPAQRMRKVLVVADDLTIGETYQFRVCAQRETPPEGIAINARVCSKLSAHRVA